LVTDFSIKKILGKLAIHYNAGKTIIYYVARYTPSHDDRVHCMVQEPGGSWHTNSPSYASVGTPVSAQEQPNAAAGITVSQDGTLIAVIGLDGFIYSYYNIDDVRYSYHPFSFDRGTMGNSCIQFTDNSDLFYLDAHPTMPGRSIPSYVHCFQYKNDYCKNFYLQPGVYI
jgi:hypothetical protein